jgi:hypothetical protein
MVVGVMRREILRYEERNSPRYSLDAEIRVTRASPLVLPQEPPLWVEGKAENISNGGVSILSDDLLPPYEVLRCEITIPGSPVRIPTLAKVRWSHKVNAQRPCRHGLQFLL